MITPKYREAAVTTTVPPLVLDVLEAADLLRCGRSTIFKLLDAGDLTAIKIGRRRLVTYESVVKFVEAQAEHPNGGQGGES